jgi:dGTPase
MMQKAQVFSLESNTSVRNRLTHSLEVADIGKTIVRGIGRLLVAKDIATAEDVECMQCIVENACLIHDIGNPPFGHFGEQAIQRWSRMTAPALLRAATEQEKPALGTSELTALVDFQNFDGNPQGFRIVTRLHSDLDEYGLNLTHSTLLASVKYPHWGTPKPDVQFQKKIGIFESELDVYKEVCSACKHTPEKRYFLAYIMELADDICYCLSDIADSFEKRVTTWREFEAEFKKICDEKDVDGSKVLPDGAIKNFGYQVSIKASRAVIEEATQYFVDHLDDYLSGEAGELSKDIRSGDLLECFKLFARRHIYTEQEVQRIEIAGSKIVEGLLEHYGRLLRLPRTDFMHFVDKDSVPKGGHLDTEWRIYKQLSPRMIKVYEASLSKSSSDAEEWLCRARLIIDYVSGLTDQYALETYQNFMGISL